MRERILEVCEEGGWPIVAWPTEDPDCHRDPGSLFEDVRHAVEHADCVVVLLGEPGWAADAELVLAFSHRRPIIGLRISQGDSPAPGVQAMLEDYERARVIFCQDPEECGDQLRAALSDPDFGATIRQAVKSQCEEDPRVSAVQVDANYEIATKTLTLAVRATGPEGPFDLVIAADKTSVRLLEGG